MDPCRLCGEIIIDKTTCPSCGDESCVHNPSPQFSHVNARYCKFIDNFKQNEPSEKVIAAVQAEFQQSGDEITHANIKSVLRKLDIREPNKKIRNLIMDK